MSQVQRIGLEESKASKEPLDKQPEEKAKEEMTRLLSRIAAEKSFLEYFIMDPSANLYFDLIGPIIDYWNDCEALTALDHQSHLDLRLLRNSIALLAKQKFSLELGEGEFKELKALEKKCPEYKTIKIASSEDFKESKVLFVPYGEIFIRYPGIFADRFLKLLTIVEKINTLIAANIRGHVADEGWQGYAATLIENLSAMLDFFVTMFVIGEPSRYKDMTHAPRRAQETKNLAEYQQVYDNARYYQGIIATLQSKQSESVVTHSSVSRKQ